MDISEVARSTVRPIEPHDVPSVVAACEWLFAPPGARPSLWDPELAAVRLTELCNAASATAFIVVAGERVIGFCTVYLDLVSIRLGQRAWLNELAVDPEFRSDGIGHSLLVHAQIWAREHGATHLMVDSSVTRVDAHRFYRRECPTFEANCFGWLL